MRITEINFLRTGESKVRVNIGENQTWTQLEIVISLEDTEEDILFKEKIKPYKRAINPLSDYLTIEGNIVKFKEYVQLNNITSATSEYLIKIKEDKLEETTYLYDTILSLIETLVIWID